VNTKDKLGNLRSCKPGRLIWREGQRIHKSECNSKKNH
jgi:hypothetical protein